MFRAFLCICVALGAIGYAFAQGTTNSPNGPEISASYIVQLTEYRLNQPMDSSKSAAEILALVSKDSDDLKRKVETIRLSASSGVESMAQFGQTVFVTVGTVSGNKGFPVQKSMQGMEIGTLVKVTVVPQNDKVAMTLTYESSSLGEAAGEDSPPDINKTKVNTTQLLDLGKSSLVSASTTSSSSILVVKVIQN
jgi:hypothetical protein